MRLILGSHVQERVEVAGLVPWAGGPPLSPGASFGFYPEAVLAVRPGRPWPTKTRAWPTQTERVIPMIPTYTTPVGLPKICLAFDWPTQIKIPRTAPGFT